MSIYGTAACFLMPLDNGNDDHVCVYVQAVGHWIDYTGPDWEWLPPPVPNDRSTEDLNRFRAVFVVTDDTKKGAERNGQEYVDPLIVMTGDEYNRITFRDLMGRVYDEVQRRYNQ